MPKVPHETTSPLWDKALRSFQEDLTANDDFSTILETGSLEELLEDDGILKPFGPRSKAAVDSMSRFKPTFKLLNDFSAVLAVSFGMSTTVTAIIWGSIRMILSLASTADTTLQDVSDMLEELSLTLPRLTFYEKSVPLEPEMENSLLAVYQEIICFYARAIHFFRSKKHTFLLRNSWPELRSDFNKTVQRIKRLSKSIESEMELSRMRLDKQKYHEVLDLMANLHSQGQNGASKNTYYVPHTEHPRFWGREDIIALIDEKLSKKNSDHSLRSFALHGMGGVGKTQVALRYANTSHHKFDAIFWISTDNLMTIGRSFREIAKTLGLIKPDIESDDNAVMLEVKTYLSSTEDRWLLIYDNADDLDLAKLAWPWGSVGSILVTSRDPAASFTLASSGSQLTPFDSQSGSTALLNILGLDVESQSNQEEAKAISSVLGGLPLALGQIGGFIAQRRIPLKNFLPMYKRNSESVDCKTVANITYDRTLANVWNMALGKLSGNAKSLHMILSFLDADYIDEGLLSYGALQVEDTFFDFVKDEIEFLDAQGVLLQGAIIDKSSESGIISMHRLIQRAIIRRMSNEERESILSRTVSILSSNFPDTYSADVGHQVASWFYCERSLPHIEHLVRQSEQFNILEKENQLLAELLLRCSWYLYERENYTVALSYIDVSLQKFADKNSLAYASAVDLRGLINLDICRPASALKAFQEAYQHRAAILPENDPFLAANHVNIGLALTELGELEKAREHLQQSINIRLKHDSNRIGNSYSNMSSLLLKMGKPEDAEVMLKSCPSLKDFSDETFLKTGNPRFSGDMIILSRIRAMQGLPDEALSFASKALSFRKECLGERLKVCDSLYQVGTLLDEAGNTGLAVELIEEIIKISEGLPPLEVTGHLARAHHKLAQIKIRLGKEKEGEKILHKAFSLREKFYSLHDHCPPSKTVASDFEALVPWMLW